MSAHPPPADPAFAPLSPEQRARTHERYEKARRQMAQPRPNHPEIHAMLLAVLLADPGNATYVQTMTEHLRVWRTGGVLTTWLDVFRGRDRGLDKALAAGEWGKVVREGLPRLARDGRNPRLIRLLAEACVGAGSFGAALAWLRYALDIFPNDGDLHRHVARLLGQIGRFDQAIECWRRVVTLVGPDDEAADMITRLSFEKAHGRSRTARLLPGQAAAPPDDEWKGLLKSGKRRRRAGRTPPDGQATRHPAGVETAPDPTAAQATAAEAPTEAHGPDRVPVAGDDFHGPDDDGRGADRTGWSASDTGEMSRQVLAALAAAAPQEVDEGDDEDFRPVERKLPAGPPTPLLPSALAAHQRAKEAAQVEAEPVEEASPVWGLPQDRDPGHAKRKVELTPRQELEDRLRDEPRIPELYLQLSDLWLAEDNLEQAHRAVHRGLTVCGPDLTLVEREEDLRLRQTEVQLQVALHHAEHDKSRASKDLVAGLRQTLNRVEIEVLQARRQRQPDEPFWTLELAVRLKRARNFEAALSLLTAIPAGTPLSARVDLEQGETLQHLSQFEPAVASYRRSLAAAESASEVGLLAAYRLGVLLSALGRYEEARPIFEGLLSVRKDYRDAAARLDNLPDDRHNA